MNIQEISQASKERAEEMAKRDGGFIVPVYAVLKTDSKGRVQSVTHDRLNGVHMALDSGTAICFLCKDVFHECEGSSYRLDAKQKEKSGVVCADCAYNPDEKLAKYNEENVKEGDRIYSFINKREYNVGLVDEHGIYTKTKHLGFPYTPRLDFKDFVIVQPGDFDLGSDGGADDL